MITRPVQLGLIEGTDKAVGPLPQSVVHGNNADLIASIAPLYLTGSVLDVTYGRGMWWRRFTPDPFGCHDIATDGVDFRALPHASSSWDAVCFDPPYVPRRSGGDPQAEQSWRDRFGLSEPRTNEQLLALIAGGLAECARVTRRWLLVKTTDYVTDRNLFLGHQYVINVATDHGLRIHDLIVHPGAPGPGSGQIHQVQRARRAHSYLLVFRKPRRGAAANA